MKNNISTVYPSTVCLSDSTQSTPAAITDYPLAPFGWRSASDGTSKRARVPLGRIRAIARSYTLPVRCPITRDDLFQEGCQAFLEAKLRNPKASDRKLLGFARKGMQQAIARYVNPLTRSLDDVVYHSSDGSDDITLADTISSGEPSALQLIAQAETIEALQAALKALSPRQQLIIRRIFEQGKPAAEIAAELGVAPVRIRVIKHELLHRLSRKLSWKNMHFSRPPPERFAVFGVYNNEKGFLNSP